MATFGEKNNNMWNVAHDALSSRKGFLHRKKLMKISHWTQCTRDPLVKLFPSFLHSSGFLLPQLVARWKMRAVENPRNYSPKFRISPNTSNAYPKTSALLIQWANKRRFLPICFELWAERKPHTEQRRLSSPFQRLGPVYANIYSGSNHRWIWESGEGFRLVRSCAAFWGVSNGEESFPINFRRRFS